jgi:outer membrane protein OmpA-like peptidoglycan-associated protein
LRNNKSDVAHRARKPACALKLTSVAALMFLAGCATPTGGGSAQSGASSAWSTVKNTFASDDPCSNNARNIGIAAGTIVGVIVGKAVGDSAVATVGGAALGALIGGFIGNDMDRKRCELSKIAKQYDLDVSFEKIDTASADAKSDNQNSGMSMTLRDNQGDGGQFKTNSDVMTPRAEAYFKAIAQQFAATETPSGVTTAEQKAEWTKTLQSRRLLLVGHTDDTGSSKVNAQLSERRARAVAAFLRKNGVPDNQLYFQGAGEGYPVATNTTEAGRAANRRVEFVEVYGDDKLQQYIEARRPNYDFYRTETVAAPAETTTVAETVKSKSKTKNTQAERKAQQQAAATAKANARTASAQQAAQNQATASVDAAKPASGVASSSPAGASTTAPVASAPVATTPVTQAATQAVPAAKASVAARAAVPGIDFGGDRLTSAAQLIDLGGVKARDTGFSFISKAHADIPYLASCEQDRPRVVGSVKSLKDDRAYHTTDHLTGLYGTSWSDMVNGNLIVLHKLSVLRDSSTPSQLPQVRLYANYDSSKKNSAKPDWQGSPEVNTYPGNNGMLYRIFTGDAKGVRCMDILFPSKGGFEAKAGKVIYQKTDALYVADFQPKMSR